MSPGQKNKHRPAFYNNESPRPIHHAYPLKNKAFIVTSFEDEKLNHSAQLLLLD